MWSIFNWETDFVYNVIIEKKNKQLISVPKNCSSKRINA